MQESRNTLNGGAGCQLSEDLTSDRFQTGDLEKKSIKLCTVKRSEHQFQFVLSLGDSFIHSFI